MALPYKRVYGSAISLPGVNAGVNAEVPGGCWALSFNPLEVGQLRNLLRGPPVLYEPPVFYTGKRYIRLGGPLGVWLSGLFFNQPRRQPYHIRPTPKVLTPGRDMAEP